MAETHSVLLTFIAKPTSLAELETQLRSLETELPKVTGCLAVRVHRHAQTPQRFSVLEDWTSQALHAEHLERVVASGAWENLAAMLLQPPESVVLEPLT